MGKGASLFIASFLCLGSVASAAPITYDATVDTSSISGTAGSLDFEFNPGPLVTQSASLQILSFASDGTLAGSPTLTGDVAGSLPAILTFDNGTGFNDYFEGFTFGSTLSFQVSLYGPALSSPDGVSTTGSTFAFSMFSDAAGTIPVLTTDTIDGFAFTVDVNLDGTTTVTNSSAQTTVVPATTPAVPEPGTLPLMAGGISLWLAFRFRRERR
jgi:PEP-CTERM motif